MPWSTRELEYLCDHYRVDQSLGEIAQALGRTYEGVKSTVTRLGLAVSRRWPAAEVELVRTQYGRRPTAAIAAELGRSLTSVYQQATRLGLTRSVPPYGEREWAIIRRLVGEGACNSCIARALGRAKGNNAKHEVAHWRRKLRLPAVGSRGAVDSCQTCKERTREGTRRQIAAAGVESLADVRALAYRRYARECGWPEDLAPREVQILNVLAERGPKTARELAEAIGARTDRNNTVTGCAQYLMGNGPGGTYTATLARRGLIENLPRWQKSGRRGVGRLPGLYTLTADALAILEQRTRSKEQQA